MESQILHHHHYTHDHDHDQDHPGVGLHQGVEGEEEGQHHEKKSVLKKVKEKAKKIKNTITKHGGHSHDEDEDDDDEDVIDDPQIQGAPLYEGAAMRSAVVGGQGQHQDVGIGMPTAVRNLPHPGPRDQTTSRPPAVDTGFTSVDNPTTKVETRDKYSAVDPNTTMSLSPWSLEKDPDAPKDKTNLHTPHNSQVKAADPAREGNEEAGESQVFDSFAKMNVNDEPKPNQTGSSSRGGDQSGYTQKISAVGSVMGGKAMAAKDYVASKLGYGETPVNNTNTKSSSSSPLEYGKQIAITVTEKLKPGEEDKALSEVISEAFSRRKDEVVKVGESAFRWQQQPQPQSKGKVTESEELTRRLGKEEDTGEEKSSAVSTAEEAGRRVVDMVKDTVGSWMGKAGDQSAPSQQSLGTSQGVEGLMKSSGVEERRREKEHGGAGAEVRVLQDSTN